MIQRSPIEYSLALRSKMFGLLAAITSLPNDREGRQALHYENYIRTGQGLPATKIYRESSSERRARKELAVVRSRQRFEQQGKLVRLMKKLLIQADQQTTTEDVDEELEQMRVKVTQLELKLQKTAGEKNLSCAEILDLEKPDDDDDLELEQMVREGCKKENNHCQANKTSVNKNCEQPPGDHTGVASSATRIDQPCDRGDHNLSERKRNEK